MGITLYMELDSHYMELNSHYMELDSHYIALCIFCGRPFVQQRLDSHTHLEQVVIID